MAVLSGDSKEQYKSKFFGESILLNSSCQRTVAKSIQMCNIIASSSDPDIPVSMLQHGLKLYNKSIM